VNEVLLLTRLPRPFQRDISFEGIGKCGVRIVCVAI